MRRWRSCSSSASASSILAGSSRDMFHQLDFRYLIERLLLAGGQDALTQHLNHPIEFGIVELGRNILDHQFARQHAGDNLHIVAWLTLEQDFKSSLTLRHSRAVRADGLVPMRENVTEYVGRKFIPTPARASGFAESVADLERLPHYWSFMAAQ